MNSTSTVRRRVLLAAVAVIVAVGVTGSVDATPKSRELAGTWDLTLVDPSTIQVQFRGSINGPGEGATVNFPVPAFPPSNLTAGGDLTIHTRGGDLLLEGTAVFNPASPGEFSFLFKIVGGTGSLAGASGWIGSVGTAEIPGTQITRALYRGQLFLP